MPRDYNTYDLNHDYSRPGNPSVVSRLLASVRVRRALTKRRRVCASFYFLSPKRITRLQHKFEAGPTAT